MDRVINLDDPNLVEKLSAKVHDSWWEEKKSQGFHAPLQCPSLDLDPEIKNGSEAYARAKFTKHCPRCHTDMYSYEELAENIKEYDRVTVRTVLKALGEM